MSLRHKHKIRSHGDIEVEINLMISYIKTLEEHIENEILNFTNNLNASYIEEENVIHEEYSRHSIDSMTFDLKEIYCEYFPNKIRASLVIFLFSVFEDHLKEICELIGSEKKYTLRPRSRRTRHQTFLQILN